ncbi:DivIVA domain-containing protein [Actinomyces trachealis]|uniref:DivIVA domain-containing protein n=1 Tax=Actinomyces trachealis TaxID=2763540 RepID=UPI001892CFCC|nr:DivIVA domain-containing protein [Actinomyces trachealis]
MTNDDMAPIAPVPELPPVTREPPAVALTASSTRAQSFAVVRFRQGYRVQDVDRLMNEAATTLAAWEAAGADAATTPGAVTAAGSAVPAGVSLQSRQVSDVLFPTTMFRPGYDQEEVDEFLDEVARTLRTWENWA